MMAVLLISASIFPAAVDRPWSLSLKEGRQDDRTVIGQTYPIVEPDALAEIEARIAKTKFDRKIFGKEHEWSALQSAILPDADVYERRVVVPFFALSFDIPDQDGGVLYPAGYTFNPLEYLKLPSRLIVVAEDQIQWALTTAKTADMVILSGGNALEATREYGRPIFKLEDRVRERLDLRFVPSIVEQEKTYFIVEEIPFPSRASEMKGEETPAGPLEGSDD